MEGTDSKRTPKFGRGHEFFILIAGETAQKTQTGRDTRDPNDGGDDGEGTGGSDHHPGFNERVGRSVSKGRGVFINR